MKKLTLDETWKLCLSMWRWLVKRGEKGDAIYSLKERWTIEHGYKKGEIRNDCFFCEYNRHRQYDCFTCPGTKIDNNFDCMNGEYHYKLQPRRFYNKLVSLNRKRLAKKRG